MKYIKYPFWAVVGLFLFVVALANRDPVILRLMPDELASAISMMSGSPMSGSLRLPLFLVIFLGIAAGLLIGFVWEWLREFGQRRELARNQQEIRRLERELKLLKAKNGEDIDDIRALID
ncbi:MAG: LapA family protein [Rhodobacteraceae bacterium]|nr:LapA family protein [Paracoccaceae bacterium]